MMLGRIGGFLSYPISTFGEVLSAIQDWHYLKLWRFVPLRVYDTPPGPGGGDLRRDLASSGQLCYNQLI